MGTRLTCVLACLLTLACAAGVRRNGDVWELENRALKVSVDAATARMTVLDKASGTLWQQEDPAAVSLNRDSVTARRVPGTVRIDGTPGEWDGVPHDEYVWLPWMGEHGERNCSAGAKVMWDEHMLYLYVRVRDDRVAFGGEATAEWWESDSVEFWVDSVQVGLHLAPAGEECAVNGRGEVYAGSRVGVRLIPEDPLPGYELEAAVPIEHFPVLKDPAPGVRFSFAIGMNDADPEPGAPVKRLRQSYYPSTWIHSVPATFAVAVLADREGGAGTGSPDSDRSAGRAGGLPGDMRPGPVPDSLVYDLVMRRGQLRELPLRITLELQGDTPALGVILECTAGPERPMKSFDYPAALYPPAPETFFTGVADYTDGRYLPADDPHCRNALFVVGGGDLPFVLSTDGARGTLTVLLTPWDAAVRMQTRAGDERGHGFPGFHWMPQKGTWGGTRRGRLAFYARGGHVAACRIYRGIAADQGLVRTLAEKAKAKPDVRRLFGAVNWWGATGLSFVREATAAGMTRGLLNGRPNPKDMREIVDRGWLVGEYDNYEDIDDAETIARGRAPAKEHAVVKADGELMTAWIVRDADMNPVHTHLKQCTAMMTVCARAVIPGILETHPYNARFLDVTTACPLAECWSPLHPVTRSEDVRCRQDLLAYVGDELGLVAGGEHGRFWDVPYLDYHEGMMGGAMYGWPAGYLHEVESRDELGEGYLRYGIDPANRAPLFELVFHDCVVNHWYWGDCNDYLHRVAPEITDRKTAMNVLYGTPPMMWAHSHGLRWQVPEERRKMLEIYRNVCKLHEQIADKQMLSHEFVTPDRRVQRSSFSDGTVCLVNFGEEPYTVRGNTGSRPDAVLRRNDFLVTGPRIEQWRLTTDTGLETYIRTETCLFADLGGRSDSLPGVSGTGGLWATVTAPGRVRVSLDPGARATLDPGGWNPAWKGAPVAVFELDAAGRPGQRLPAPAAGGLHLSAPGHTAQAFMVVLGDAARAPDASLADLLIRVAGEPLDPVRAPGPDSVLDITAEVANAGLTPARDLTVSLHLDRADGPPIATRQIPMLSAGATAAVRAEWPAARADGPRRVVAVLGVPEGAHQSGRLQREAAFTGPFRPEAFRRCRPLTLTVPPGAAGLPGEQPFALGDADPGNLRVRFANGTVVPAQFEPGSGDRDRGTLVFVIPPGLPAGTHRAAVFAALPGPDGALPLTGTSEVTPDGTRLRFGTYSAAIVNGTLGGIAVRQAGGGEKIVASRIIVSCEETRWTLEDGDVETFALTADGPVRTVFRCTKRVSDRFVLQREWRFYADRFEVRTSCDPPISALTCAFFTVDAHATHENGGRAEMDGRGEVEGFGFEGTPQWYALFADDWNAACIALSPAAGLVYWDSGSDRGQVSLDTAGGVEERRVFIWGPGAGDDSFARTAAAAYARGIGLE
jgi:hypothetical protein